jgi:hypothetical protein
MRDMNYDLKPPIMITNHFRKRLRERTPYNDIETLWSDIENKMDNVLKLKRDSEELRYYPFLKNKFTNYPNSTILVLEWMGIGLVSDNNTLITILNLY